MPILNVKVDQAGMAGVEPKFIYIDTNDTVATITAAGYLNSITQKFGIPLIESSMALVSSKTSVSAASVQVGLYDVSKSGDNWSLTASETILPLDSAHVFVGNAGGIATDVAMTGDVGIDNAGVTTIQAGAVDLAMLSAGITPSHVVAFAGKEANGGGSATVAITVTGVAATDIVFAQLQASTNAATVQKVTPTTNTITVLLSADPGAATSISYQALRAAS